MLGSGDLVRIVLRLASLAQDRHRRGVKFTVVNEPRADEEPGLNHRFLGFVAGRVAAGAAIRFEATLGRVLAEVSAKNFAGSYRRAYRTVADVVAALDAKFTHLQA